MRLALALWALLSLGAEGFSGLGMGSQHRRPAAFGGGCRLAESCGLSAAACRRLVHQGSSYRCSIKLSMLQQKIGEQGNENDTPAFADAAPTKVKCIFSDVDGTLLDKEHTLRLETQQAILDAIAAGIPFVMATGKSRGPWVQDVRRQLGFTGAGYSLNGPGVFIQGLLVCDESGEPVQQLLLPAPVIQEMNTFATKRSISLVAYTTDDRIVCSETDEHTDKIIPFNEPVPEAIAAAGMSVLAQPSQPGVYKMMLMGHEPTLAETRPELEALLVGKATVTKAMDEMLEILPLGASKWSGVAKALELVGFSPGECLVMGDGENDLEMLLQVKQAGGVAVAVGNAVPRLKAAATHVMEKDHDAGAAAEAIQRFALGKAQGR